MENRTHLKTDAEKRFFTFIRKDIKERIESYTRFETGGISTKTQINKDKVKIVMNNKRALLNN